MSRRWLFSAFALSVPLLFFVQLSGAEGVLRVNEAGTTLILKREPAEVRLAIGNLSGEILRSRVQVELLDPRDQIVAQSASVTYLTRGSQLVSLSLPFHAFRMAEKEPLHLLWYRLRYRVTPEQKPNLTIEGIVSVSRITPDLFALRIATSGLAREGRVYRARVQATHPITHAPTKGVAVDTEVVLMDGDEPSVKLRASAVTDDQGYAYFQFPIPTGYPSFPHQTHPAGGEIIARGQRGEFTAETKGDVLVNQFAQILISTDKPLYQPGQMLHIRALALRPSGRALPDQKLVFTIADPEESKLLQTEVKTTRFGIAALDWPIPDNSRLGDYRILASFDGEEEGPGFSKVRVSRYDLPNFAVKVTPDRHYYLPGQNAEVSVRADYLFGQPVTRGHVRVVRETEREWNYREQKWDIEEGDKYEGETDTSGVFVAHINLAADHSDIAESEYQRFHDSHYTAYFTDPTTRRTEQRHFDLRVTKEAIHVYVISSRSYTDQPSRLPLKFYLSTFYADGMPATCAVKIAWKKTAARLPLASTQAQNVQATIVRTSRYGLARASLRLPEWLVDETEANLILSARDGDGRTGYENKELTISDNPAVQIETNKIIYRPGEPITAIITANVPSLSLVVDLGKDQAAFRTKRVQLVNGQATVTFPYGPDLKDLITVAAYPDFPQSRQLIASRTVMYPREHDLKLEVQATQASYRPGDQATVSLRVRPPGEQPAESALGITVFDQAVDERSRTDLDGGGRSYGFYGPVRSWHRGEEQLAGVSLRDLERLNTSRPVPADLEVLAEVLLNQSYYYLPEFVNDENFEANFKNVFADLLKAQLDPLKTALATRHTRTFEYPRNEETLRTLLAQEAIQFDSIRDPWGNQYRPVFSINKQADELNLISAGPDKQFNTVDDFPAASMSWPYFQPLGLAINRAVQHYHERTGEFIRDVRTLQGELKNESIDLAALRDRWGKPYRFEFEARQREYEIKVSSSGPDGQFAVDRNITGDDFILWVAAIDYFAGPRKQIEAALAQYTKTTQRFPRSDAELNEALRGSSASLSLLSDPWGHPFYASFRQQASYADSVQISNQTGGQRTEIQPVTRTVSIVVLRSCGPDGRTGTPDDFDVANFGNIVSEQSGKGRQPGNPSSIVLSEGTGAIAGVVTDPAGAIVSGVKVTAVSVNQAYETTSDSDGRYTLLNMLPGIYEVRFACVGFKFALVYNVMVESSGIATINVRLEVGKATESVTVTSDAPTVQTRQIQDLPINGSRRYLNFTLLKPGAVNIVTKSGSRDDQTSTPRLREYFPETLFWQPSIETDKQGRAQINFKLADNITTWKVGVIGSNEAGEIGTAEAEIKAFQPFFVEHDPPRVLTEGDQISLPVVVRNYLPNPQSVDLEIKPESWFALIGAAHKQTEVPAGDAVRQTFDLRAVASVKNAKQQVSAISALERDARDAIEKPVTVHPDGEERTSSVSDLLRSQITLSLNLPADTIPNSQYSELKIYPNLMAHVIESVEAIMERPHGCAEQTISSAYPSLLFLRQAKLAGKDPPAGSRAQRYLQSGYDQLLNYRDEDGAFSYWGRGEPDVAVTAYALKFFKDARGLINVNEDLLEETRTWLIKQQRLDGSWAAYKFGQKAEDKQGSALLTSYVTRVLAAVAGKAGTDIKEKAAPKTGTADQDKSVSTAIAVKRALVYLEQRSREIDEPYLLASFALAALDASEQVKGERALARLRELVHSEEGTAYWSLETNTPFYGWGRAGRVETTALVVQAFARANAVLTAEPGARSASTASQTDAALIRSGLLFLLKQKDRYGVWYSTQTTINVLDTMLLLLRGEPDSPQASADVAEILINGRAVKKIDLPSNTELVAPVSVDVSKYLSAGSNIVEVKRANPSSVASAQVVADYYVPWTPASGARMTVKEAGDNSAVRLSAKFDRIEAGVGDQISCHVEAERIGFRGYGMMLAEIGLPPGADVDRESLEKAMRGSGWAMSQYDILPDRVVVYLWPTAGGIKFDFTFRPRFGMNAETAPSLLYDYYNPEARAVLAPERFVVK
jgi:hypothetical protein